jgi:CMP/dCMP kinase
VEQTSKPSPKKHIITIAGRPGSGKSTAAKGVAKRLGYKHFSSGDFFRQLGKEQGVDVLEANLSAENNYKIDRLVDARLKEIGENQDKIVIDSRTAWHWIPSSFKIFLELGVDKAAKRILKEMTEDRRLSEHIHDDPIEYARFLHERLSSETRRYKAIYGIDPYDMAHYNLVIDTSKTGAVRAIKQIVESYQAWLEQR